MPDTPSHQRIFAKLSRQNVYRSENCCTLGSVSADKYTPSVLLVTTLFGEESRARRHRYVESHPKDL